LIKIALLIFLIVIWKWEWFKQLSFGWKTALTVWVVVGMITFVIWTEIAKVW
jgi:hypothetical protein